MKYYKSLTGLRFIAALMVFITHLAPRTFHPFINDFISELQIGVPIFFVLSGFLIYSRYFDNISIVKDGISHYFTNRFIRIYPLYFIVALANICWYNMNFDLSFLHITFLHGFSQKYAFNPLAHTWSLTVECTFYILIPLIFLLISKKINIYAQFLLFLIIGFLITILSNYFNSEPFWGDYKFMLLLTFFGRSFEFYAGMQLAMWINQNKVIPIMKWKATYIGIILLTLTLIFLTFIPTISFVGIFVHNIIVALGVSILLFGLINENTIINTVLSSKFFLLLGNSSYAFFLIHYGVWQRFMIKYLFIDFLLELIATILLSIILYKGIEEPLIKMYKRKRKSKEARITP